MKTLLLSRHIDTIQGTRAGREDTRRARQHGRRRRGGGSERGRTEATGHAAPPRYCADARKPPGSESGR